MLLKLFYKTPRERTIVLFFWHDDSSTRAFIQRAFVPRGIFGGKRALLGFLK